METYGLPDPTPTPDLEGVQQQIEQQAQTVLGVVRTMGQNTTNYLQSNSQKIDKVVKRLNNSIAGHLRRNKAVLNQVGTALMAPVSDALAKNQAAIGAAMMSPQIASEVRAVPVPASYQYPTPVIAAPDGAAAAACGPTPPPLSQLDLHTIYAIAGGPPVPYTAWSYVADSRSVQCYPTYLIQDEDRHVFALVDTLGAGTPAPGSVLGVYGSYSPAALYVAGYNVWVDGWASPLPPPPPPLPPAPPGSPILPPPPAPSGLAPPGSATAATVGVEFMGCPPGWHAQGEMCVWCPPERGPESCIVVPPRQAWQRYYAGQGGTFGVTGSPPAAGSSGTSSGSAGVSGVGVGATGVGLGTTYVTGLRSSRAGGAGSAVGAGSGTVCYEIPPADAWQQYQSQSGLLVPVAAQHGCPPGFELLPNGMCRWCYSAAAPPPPAPPPFLSPPPPPAPPPPPPPPLPPSQCPQTYTILQGPPCPQYVAVQGTPALWAQVHWTPPPGWTVLITVTDTPEDISTKLNSLKQQCVNATITGAPSPPAAQPSPLPSPPGGGVSGTTAVAAAAAQRAAYAAAHPNLPPPP